MVSCLFGVDLVLTRHCKFFYIALHLTEEESKFKWTKAITKALQGKEEQKMSIKKLRKAVSVCERKSWIEYCKTENSVDSSYHNSHLIQNMQLLNAVDCVRTL